MTIDEARRAEFYKAFCDSVGKNATDTLMEMIPPHDWSDVARKGDLEILRADFDARWLVIEHDITRINRTLGWMIGGMLTVGTGIIAMLIQVSLQVASLT